MGIILLFHMLCMAILYGKVVLDLIVLGVCGRGVHARIPLTRSSNNNKTMIIIIITILLSFFVESERGSFFFRACIMEE
ncbi:hypothetical protein ACJX0J_023556, partial [Zea mays]